MDNSQSINTKGSDTGLQELETIIPEIKEHMIQIDNAVTDLARTIDAMQLSCQMFFEHNVTTQKETGFRNSNEMEVQLLKSLSSCLYNNKDTMVKTVADFLNFLAERGNLVSSELQPAFMINTYTRKEADMQHESWEDIVAKFHASRIDSLKKEIESTLEMDVQHRKQIQNLSNRNQYYKKAIDILEAKLREKEKQLEESKRELPVTDDFKVEDGKIAQNTNICSQKNDNEKDSENCDSANKDGPQDMLDRTIDEPQSTCELLQNMGELKDISHITKEENAKLKAEKCQVDDEKNNWRRPTEILLIDKEIQVNLEMATEIPLQNREQNENQIMEYHEKLSSLTAQNHDLAKLLTERRNLTCTKRLSVQVYHPEKFSASSAENNLLAKLTVKMATEEILMETDRLSKTVEYDNETPLLISANHEYGRKKTNTVDTALKLFKKGAKTRIAVIVFHRNEEKEIKKEIEIFAKSDDTLGGVFHVSHKSQLHLPSALNDKAIDKISTFLKQYIIPNTDKSC